MTVESRRANAEHMTESGNRRFWQLRWHPKKKNQWKLKLVGESLEGAGYLHSSSQNTYYQGKTFTLEWSLPADAPFAEGSMSTSPVVGGDEVARPLPGHREKNAALRPRGSACHRRRHRTDRNRGPRLPVPRMLSSEALRP